MALKRIYSDKGRSLLPSDNGDAIKRSSMLPQGVRGYPNDASQTAEFGTKADRIADAATRQDGQGHRSLPRGK